MDLRAVIGGVVIGLIPGPRSVRADNTPGHVDATETLEPVRAGVPVARAIPEQQAVALTAEARAAAQSGHCDVVARLDGRVHELDSEYYETTFETDPAIEACLHPTQPEVPARDRFMAGAGVSAGTGLQADLRFGWMISPWLGVFGSVFIGAQISDENNDYRVFAGGLRMWLSDRVFVDARGGFASGYHAECAPAGEPCTKTGVGVWGGVGLELVHDVRYGLELHVEIAGGGGAGIIGGGIGASFY